MKSSTDFAMQALREQRERRSGVGGQTLNDLRDVNSGYGNGYDNYTSAPISKAERANMESRAYSLLSVSEQRKVDQQKLEQSIADANRNYKEQQQANDQKSSYKR